jgi:hypothetical protein
MILGAVEVNGPVVTQILLEQLEKGQISQEEFLEKMKANNQATYDYIKMLGQVLRPTDEVRAWHDVREAAFAKRKEGEYIVKA